MPALWNAPEAPGTPAGPDFRWAVLGPGRIAQRFAAAVTQMPGARLHAVHGRSAKRARAFAAAHPQPRGGPVQVVPRLEALLASPQVDAVYIATPHSEHAALAHLCLEAGKPVLCEKPLVPTLAAGQKLVQLSQARGVFLMEALWSRFLPAWRQLRQWLDEGAIGPVRHIDASFCFDVPFDANSRMFAPALAGGSLLDIGIYTLAATRFVLETAPGTCPAPLRLQASGALAPSGVDRHVDAWMEFEGGVRAHCVCAFDRASPSGNALVVDGERGRISLPADFWQATSARLERPGQAPLALALPHAFNGFEGEIAEAMRCVRAGRVQSPAMPHAETLALLDWMDRLRAQLGVRYPFE